MRIYLLPDDFTGDDRYIVTGKDAHYLTRVLRLTEGCSFPGRDRSGRSWTLTLTHIAKGSCTLFCSLSSDSDLVKIDTLPDFRGPFPEIHVYQAVCKGKKMDQIIRQVTELGVSRIVPVISTHTVADISAKASEKVNRYETVIKEAIQQSGSPVPTRIDPPLAIGDVVNDWNHRGTALLFHQSNTGSQLSLSEYLSQHDSTKALAVMVGAEGGFSPSEVELLIQGGFSPVLLKTNILRAETAAVAAVAIVQHILVDTLSHI